MKPSDFIELQEQYLKELGAREYVKFGPGSGVLHGKEIGIHSGYRGFNLPQSDERGHFGKRLYIGAQYVFMGDDLSEAVKHPISQGLIMYRDQQPLQGEDGITAVISLERDIVKELIVNPARVGGFEMHDDFYVMPLDMAVKTFYNRLMEERTGQ